MVAVLIACLLAAPTDCRTVELYLTDRMPIAAMMEGQQRAAEWLAGHPGTVLRSLRVVPGRAV